ncbi:MAG: spondin domain-containing protein [Patescibacteria group bacterium]
MRKSIFAVSILLAAVVVKATVATAASVTVMLHNITDGQTLSRPIYGVGPCGVTTMFNEGKIASVALEQMAEGGISSPLVTFLQSKGWKVLLGPGTILGNNSQTMTITVPSMTATQHPCIAVISMLVPTNDGFIALQDLYLFGGYALRWMYVPAYDAGTEYNDELCASIPTAIGYTYGTCPVNGQGFNSTKPWPRERTVTAHKGLHGRGNLKPADSGFNPERPAKLMFWYNP